ncbi:MAG: dihydroxy-acid dehydratase, partial [Methanomassiliicoccales archaeon]|nr:dihydroxy-acid dehydratase [Methanomassiliicoccales archaeon]
VKNGDKIRVDIPGRELELLISDRELQSRLKRFKPPDRELKGILGKYRKLVSSASEGAICR